jgi:hypothetical protein
LALAARAGDASARNDLFACLADPIAAVVRRHRRFWWPLEPDEVTSESFLALADLLDYWPDLPFRAFFQDAYPLLLRRRLLAGRWPNGRTRPLLPIDLNQTSAAAVLELDLIEQTCDLQPLARWLVEWRVAGLPAADLAPALGCSPRQAQRRWRAIVGQVAQHVDRARQADHPRRR